MTKIRNFLFISLFVPFISYAQFNYHSNVENLHTNVLKLNGNTKQLKVALLNEPNGLYYWLLAYNDFLQYHFGNNFISNETLSEKLDNYYEELKHFEKDSPYYNFCITELCLYKAFTYIEAGSYYSAGKNLIRANKLIEKNKSKYPRFFLNIRHELVQMSIDYWLIKHIPFLFKEEKEKGENRLRGLIKRYTQRESLNAAFNSEANLLVLFVSSRILDDKSLIEQLILGFPCEWKFSGSLEALASSQFLPASKSNLKKNILQHAINNGYNAVCNKLNLSLGIVYLNELNDSCLTCFTEFKQKQNSKRDLLFANLKLSWYYYMQQAFDSVQILVEESKSKKAITNNDLQAAYEFKNVDNWDSEIIKARVLFDGGFHEQALEVLLSKQVLLKNKNSVQYIELMYRLARIYHEIEDFEKALSSYLKVIESKTESQFYYSAYSAYYVGRIHEFNNDCDMAMKYYKKCINLDSPIYRESIHRKAFNRIENCIR